MSERRASRRTVLAICMGVPLLLGSVGSIRATCREDVLAKAATYETWPYYVTSANVGPAIPCYYGTTGCYAPAMPVGGPYYGVPYSFRTGDWMSAPEIGAQLADGVGAGNHKCLYMYTGQTSSGKWPCTTVNRSAPSCVINQITGIDCSSFVSAAWDVPRFGTGSIPSTAAQPMDPLHPEYLQTGDALVKAGDHMVLLASNYSAYTQRIDTYEASGSAGQIIYNEGEPYADYLTGGFIPYVANKLKDNVISVIARFDITVGDPTPRVRWETLFERNTAYFSVWGSPQANGAFTQLSPDIPARGSAQGGAAYEFAIPQAHVDIIFVKLVETETSGRVIPHGVRSLAEAAAMSVPSGGRAER